MSTTRNTLIDAALRNQVFIERLKTGLGEEFAGVFGEIWTETREQLSTLEVEKVSDLSTRKLDIFLAVLFAANIALIADAQADFFRKLGELAEYEAAFEARTFQQLSAKLKTKTLTAAEAYEAALAQPLTANGKLLETFVTDWTREEIERINDTIRSAWGQGWTVDKLTTAFRGTKKLGYADGILGGAKSIARRNVEAVSSTAVQHVASAARAAFWERNAGLLDGWRFVATLDSRTTQRCRSLDGRIFKVGEGPVPPLHIRCRSTTIAVLKAEWQVLEEGATRASMDGYVDANLTYYEWLKQQPAAFQDAAIGPVRGKLFRDGGLSAERFAELNLGRNFQPLTLVQMKELEPLAFERAGI